MKFVKVTVDGVTYNLTQSVNGEWLVTNRAPRVPGEYFLTVTLTTEAGREIVIDTTDEDLADALLLLVQAKYTQHGQRMLNYYPEVIKNIEEFRALMMTEGFEIDFLHSELEFILNEAYLLTMSESRVAEWEKRLQLLPSVDDTFEDRRDTIIATIRGSGKLNTALISSIVNAFTGGSAISYVKDSALIVKITPPPGNKQYRFENVVNVLKRKTPAHLGLRVERNYSTWGEIKTNFASWNTLNEHLNADGQGATWEDIKLWIAPQ